MPVDFRTGFLRRQDLYEKFITVVHLIHISVVWEGRGLFTNVHILKIKLKDQRRGMTGREVKRFDGREERSSRGEPMGGQRPGVVRVHGALNDHCLTFGPLGRSRGVPGDIVGKREKDGRIDKRRSPLRLVEVETKTGNTSRLVLKGSDRLLYLPNPIVSLFPYLKLKSGPNFSVKRDYGRHSETFVMNWRDSELKE